VTGILMWWNLPGPMVCQLRPSTPHYIRIWTCLKSQQDGSLTSQQQHEEGMSEDKRGVSEDGPLPFDVDVAQYYHYGWVGGVIPHTPETKHQSKQWLAKGMPGLMKAKVHASRKKQMVLAFFNAQGLIYSTRTLCPGAKLSTLLTSLRP
jgi:hypothetical protein